MANETMALPVKLTPEELAEKSREVVCALKEKAQIAADAKTAAGEARQKVKFLDARIERVGEIVREKQETRQVEIEVERDMTTRTVTIKRKDTGEVVSRRVMSFEERQGKLWGNKASDQVEKTDTPPAPEQEKSEDEEFFSGDSGKAKKAGGRRPRKAASQ